MFVASGVPNNVKRQSSQLAVMLSGRNIILSSRNYLDISSYFNTYFNTYHDHHGQMNKLTVQRFAMVTAIVFVAIVTVDYVVALVR